MAAKKEPKTPAPHARRKAMNEMPVAIGWRIITRVRPFTVARDASEKDVCSMSVIKPAALYPIWCPEQKSRLPSLIAS